MAFNRRNVLNYSAHMNRMLEIPDAMEIPQVLFFRMLVTSSNENE